MQFTPGTGTAVNWGCDHALTITVSDERTGQTSARRSPTRSTGTPSASAAAAGRATAAIPGNTTFVAASGGITPAGGVLTWNLGSQRPMSQGSAWFTVTANSGPLATTRPRSPLQRRDPHGHRNHHRHMQLAVGLADFNATQAEFDNPAGGRRDCPGHAGPGCGLCLAEAHQLNLKFAASDP